MPVTDQGVHKDYYKLIPRVLIFVTREDSVLLLKGSPNKQLWANLFNGIGGQVERGEDVETAARREFKEETGLDLINPWLCAVITIDTDKLTGIGLYVFRGEVSDEEPKPSGEGNLEWIPANQLNTLPLVEDLLVLLPRILKMQTEDIPLSVHYYYNDKNQLVVKFNSGTFSTINKTI